MDILEEIVRTDDKQRYSFNEDKTLVRANQGHSIPVDAVQIDAAIGKYLDPKSSLLCTDTGTNYKKFDRIKGLKHEPINERAKTASKERYLSYPKCKKTS